MKICHIVSHIDEEASGPAYSVPRLGQSLSEVSLDVTLATLDRGGPRRNLRAVRHLAFSQAIVPRRLGRSSKMRHWARGLQPGSFDLLHSHGLWMMPNLYPAIAARRTQIPHVIAPRGTLDPAALRFSRTRKRAFWIYGQGRALRQARALHATSAAEAQHFRNFGLRQPIIVLPNGIDIPPQRPKRRSGARTLLYLGRLHEKKGLDMLLAAWADLQDSHPDWDLRIVGTGRASFVAQLKDRANALGLTRIRIEPALYGEDKRAALQHSDLLVLPTRSENFAMVIAEALAAGTPVLTTKGAPWPDLSIRRCGWRTDIPAEAIKAGLSDAMAHSPEQLTDMGARGRAWMSDAFSWTEIGQRMAECYEWLRTGGRAPDHVWLQ